MGGLPYLQILFQLCFCFTTVNVRYQGMTSSSLTETYRVPLLATLWCSIFRLLGSVTQETYLPIWANT